ncbi:DNA double-strand break repair Rad50 ATPase [Actinidia chinensis var. chinensis]|uniref:DNA double-strand break repair Rad50 ATPase n=1 Tax=Actinidia chinensis var. chinensis TaxID=1590841 RepID=A0A2R6PA64_ACTCC|nr:DNA double-strand break repair Rad50 ATPase [Actinidia chinensis var. chinensis]
MESEEHVLISELKKKILQIFSDFMTRVTQFEELGAVGNRFLVGFHQGLEFLRQPPINKTSKLVNSVIRANETERVLKYFEAGCVNTHDSVQNISKLHTCQLGLKDHLSKAKCIVNELEVSVKEVTGVMQTANESKPYLMDNVTGEEFGPEATAYDEEIASSDLQKPEITDYVAMMGVIYSMVKNDYIMQERIISSLGLKSSSGELESYTLMWSLRPFVNDEIMHQAWRLIQ